jgi:2-hydroxy-6-oxonona-2,4-dienedioate hydrolase
VQSINYPLAVGTGVTRIIEAGSGPAVLFVHGLGARADRWRSTLERIADQGFRAIAWDLPGHGFASKEANGPGDVPALAEHALAVMESLNVADGVMVGTSLGAHIVAYAACRQPGRVRALVLVGALGIVPIDQAVAETISRNVRATKREQFSGKLSFVMHDPAMVTESLIEEEWRMNTAPGTIEVFSRLGDYLTTNIARDYVAAQLSDIYPPDKLLLIWGEQDKAVPLAVGHACRTALHDPRLIIIAEANHCPYLEQPAAFDAALLPFLHANFQAAVDEV